MNLDWIDILPLAWMEVIGASIGFFACGCILFQLISECRTHKPSTLSSFYILGFAFIYFFWMLYGLRHRAIALWLTNAIATLLQVTLFCVILYKRKSQ